MFKKSILFILMIAVLLSSACTEETMASNDAQELLDLIDQRIDQRIPTQPPKFLSATVVSTSGGSATVHLPTDPMTTTLTVSNPAEVPVEVGDEVYILAINGNVTNSIIGYRKTITLDDIYVDYTNGVDSSGYNSSGNQYGSSAAPFKTLRYVIRRLPKNLNNRNIVITIQNAPSGGGDPILFTDGFYAGNLIIQGLVGTYADVNTLWMSNCSASISLRYLTPKNSGGLYLLRFSNCSNVSVNSCSLTTAETNGVSATNNSSVAVTNSVISNQVLAALIASNNSKIYSENNTGDGNSNVFYATANSVIGVIGTEPSGTTRASADASSIIRP